VTKTCTSPIPYQDCSAETLLSNIQESYLEEDQRLQKILAKLAEVVRLGKVANKITSEHLLP